jgi:drug/metabolite transporter (DMT)-like permease
MNSGLIFIISLIVTTSICDTISQLFLKTAINSLNFHLDSLKKIFIFIIKLLTIPRLWIGFTFSCLSLFIWLFILSRVDLNFAFSLDSMHYIFIAFASGIFLKERVGLLRWAGTLLIMAGVILVSFTAGG